ncbi:efflux RND transporter periplasmic adaptor subunit [Gallaecimonas sp. GXIMD4217]|uniref:efflux RND transporter periplasmic adaptor subunit n=1 Tax=Gallaecimonas sp. GXIMD4217 TaxID=3131927 RepID=UPI00311B3584
MRYLPLMVLGLALVGCSKAPEQAAEEQPPRPVKLHYIGATDDAQVRHFPGEVSSTDGSTLAFRLPGQIVELPVRNAQEVTKDQLLAKLDDTDYRNQLLDRQAQFELAEAQFNRAVQMLEKKLIPQATFDEAKAKRTQAQAALRLARDNMAYTELRAPYDGVIAKRLVENFQFVQAKEPIFQLQNDEMIDVVIQVPERLISRVRKDAVGYQPEVRFEGAPELSFKARYKEHDAIADAATRTFRVILTLAKPEQLNVLPGMSVDVAVEMNKVFSIDDLPKLTVPVEAVFQPDDKEGSFVWRYDAETGTVQLQAVTLGQVVSGGVEITQGLSAGDTVVAAGVSFLEQGQRVRPLAKERGL